MTTGDIDHRGGVITPLCSEYHVLVYIECGQTVLYFDTTQKKKKKTQIAKSSIHSYFHPLKY